jgi:hypothetical protein
MILALNYAKDEIEVSVGNGTWGYIFIYPISPPEYDSDVYLYFCLRCSDAGRKNRCRVSLELAGSTR